MMEEKTLKDLPPSYTNLGYDADPVAGPSAPKIESSPAFAHDVPGPSSAYPQPSAPLPDLEVPSPRTLFLSPPALVFENIYEACIQYADKHCCYGKRFVNQMKLTEILNKTVYHYKLESFGEKRESAPRSTPFRGGSVDGPENGRPPDPWDMTVSPSSLFKDHSTDVCIPHTETVEKCWNCSGDGNVTCDNCYGRREEDCDRCRGWGKISGDDNEDVTCPKCRGYKKQTCTRCNGTGKITCRKCDGYGRLKKYRILIVTWKNHPTNSMTSTDQLPQELILKAEGVELWRETAKKLHAITNTAESEVNDLSAATLQAHKISFPNELIIRQKHVLRAIPFTLAKYKWKDREGEFYIYGANQKVYFEDYPQQCCCCTCC